jgi:hypothetical protein
MANERDLEARRIYLREGSYHAVALALGVSKQRAYVLIQRANKSAPLSVPTVTVNVASGTPTEDRDAIGVAVRSALEKVGITR